MLQNILTIGRPVFKPSKQFDQFMMYPVESKIKDRPLTFFFYGSFDFLFNFINNFFNPGWMYPSVFNEAVKRNPSYLSPYRIKA